MMKKPRPPILLPLALLSVLPGLTRAGADWPAFRGDAHRSGNEDRCEVPLNPGVRWIFRGKGYTSPRIDSSPAVVNGAVYVGVSNFSVFSPSGRIICLDLESGKRRWEQKTLQPVFSSPAVSGGRVFVGEGYHQDQRSRLYCLDAATGKKLWFHRSRSHIESSPRVEGDRLYVGAGEDGVYCLSVKDGSTLWHFEKQHVDISPAVGAGGVFAGTGYGAFCSFCLSAGDGRVLWRTPERVPVWGSPLVLENRVFFGIGNGNFTESAPRPRGAVICLDAGTGKEIWRRSVPDAVLTAISYRKGKIFFGCRDGNLYAANPARGMILWSCPAGGPLVASPALGDRRVAAVTSRGLLVIAAAGTGEKLAAIDLSRLLSEEVRLYSSPALSGGRIILGTSTGAVVCLEGQE